MFRRKGLVALNAFRVTGNNWFLDGISPFVAIRRVQRIIRFWRSNSAQANVTHYESVGNLKSACVPGTKSVKEVKQYE